MDLILSPLAPVDLGNIAKASQIRRGDEGEGYRQAR